MTIGQKAAVDFKRQYCIDGKWYEFTNWDIQPKEIYVILKELKSKEAVMALMGNDSWIRALSKKGKP